LQFLYIVCGQNSPPIKLLLLPQVLFRFSPSKIKLWLVVLWFGLALESTFHSIPFQLLVLLTPRFVINNCGRKIHSSFHDLLVFCCCCCCCCGGVLGVEILQTCELVLFCVFVCCFDIGTRLDSRFVTVEEPSTDFWTLIFTKILKPNFILFFKFFSQTDCRRFFFSLGKWCALDSEDYAVEERDLVIDFSLEFLVVRIARTVIDCKSAEAKSLGACIAQLPKIADEEERA